MAVPWEMLAQLGVQALSEGKAGEMDKEAKARLERMLASYKDLPEPLLEALIAEQLGPSELGQVTADPELKSAQMAALSKLKQMEEGGGFTLEDQANLTKIQNQLSRKEAGNRGAILESMQARGVGGSGAELAAQLASQQGSAQRAGEAGLDIAAQAQKRYLDSVLGRGHMAGQMREQDFGEKSQAARARDAITDYNVRARERAQLYNKNLPQSRWENTVRRLGAMGGSETALSGLGMQQAAGTRVAGAGLGVAAKEAVKAFRKKDDDEEDSLRWA